MTHTTATQPLRPPTRLALLGEVRVGLEIARMGASMLNPFGATHTTRPRQIIVLPGFGADDRACIPLRRHLRQRGHRAEGWGLGRNVAGMDIPHTKNQVPPGWDITSNGQPYRGEAGVPWLCHRMTERIAERHAGPLTLIGWSLGGVVAREVARELPNVVEQVITLGTPVIGGPRYTTAGRVFIKRGMDMDWIERESAKRDQRPIQVPVCAIYSESDGIVSAGATVDHHSPNVQHLQVRASHLGMVFNPSVWRVIDQVLG